VDPRFNFQINLVVFSTQFKPDYVAAGVGLSVLLFRCRAASILNRRAVVIKELVHCDVLTFGGRNEMNLTLRNNTAYTDIIRPLHKGELS